MATGMLFLILLITIFFAIIKSKKACIISFVIFCIGFVLIGYGILPALFMKSLEVSGAQPNQLHWKTKNAIVVLGFGNVKPSENAPIKSTVFSYSRIFAAAEAYFSCKRTGQRCVLILSGGDPGHMGLSEAEAYRNELLGIGVNDFDIELEPHSLNTYQNAEFTNAILKSGNYDYVVLITSGFHLKRSLLYFNHFGIHPTAISSDFIKPQIALIPLGYNFALMDFASHEVLGLARLHVYSFFGWNFPTPASQGAV